MQCPKCRSERTEVTKVMPFDTVNIRKRRCGKCGYIFPTYETIQDEKPVSVASLAQEWK